MHTGNSQTLAEIRKEYWIPKGRAEVRRVLKNCTTCRKWNSGPFRMPQMPSIPECRVKPSAPFTYTGVDYFGPLYVTETEETKKVWTVLFTCMVVRAIHLELVSDMTTERFLLAIRRFIARRGKPDHMMSDNALQFKKSTKVLDKAWEGITNDSDVKTYVSNHGIQWSFITELAPWMGGFYERMVGIVKRSLKKAIGNKALTSEELQTFMIEAEAVVNSRPLTYINEDINSNSTISPADFLTLNPKIGIPQVEKDPKDPEFHITLNSREKLLNTWTNGQYLLNQFWSIWRDEYLTSLRERTQTHLKGPRVQTEHVPQEGDIVLIKENRPRGCWKIARIDKLISSKDGNIRTAQVTLPSSKTLKRPLNLLCPLEFTSQGHVVKKDVEADGPKDQTKETDIRPKRKAAILAEKKLQELLSPEDTMI